MVWSSYHAWHRAFRIPCAFYAHALEHPSSLLRESLAHIPRFSLSVAVLWVEYIPRTWVLLQSFLPYSILPFHPCSWASPFIGHWDLVGVSDLDLPISCVLIMHHTIPGDMASSAEVASAESHLAILCFDNISSTGLLHGRLLCFDSDSAGRLSWYHSSCYTWQEKHGSIVYFWHRVWIVGVVISKFDLQMSLDGGASCRIDTFKEEAPLLKVH